MVLIRISKSKVLLVILILALRLALDISYYQLVVPYFSWTDSRYVFAPNIFKLVESYFFTLFFALSLNSKVKTPSDFLIAFLFLIPILPTFSLYGMADGSRIYTYMITIVFLIILIVPKIFPRLKIPSLKKGSPLGLGISMLGVIISLAFFIVQGGFQYISFNFLDIGHVYELREAINITVFQGNILFAYISFWTYYVFMSVLIIWAIYRKHYGIFLVLIGFQLLFYGFSLRRGVLATIPIILGTYLIVERRFALNWMISGFFILVVASMGLVLTVEEFVPASLIIERFFFTPARLNYAFYELFSDVGFVYMSNVHLPIPIDYPFEDNPAIMVSKYIFHTDSVASAGFLATSYMHFGFIGMIIFAFIVGILIRIIDSLIINRLPMRYGVPIAAITFYSLFTSADLTTALMTYGILPAILLLWFLGSRKVIRCRKLKRMSLLRFLE